MLRDIDSVQLVVANELRDGLGLAPPCGGAINEATAAKLQTLLEPERMTDLIEKAKEESSFMLVLEKINNNVVSHLSHIKDKKKQPTDYQEKHDMLKTAEEAISQYRAIRDLGQLDRSVSAIKQKDDSRPKSGLFKHPSSDIIRKLYNTVSQRWQQRSATPTQSSILPRSSETHFGEEKK